jgi:hypothetical protein
VYLGIALAQVVVEKARHDPTIGSAKASVGLRCCERNLVAFLSGRSTSIRLRSSAHS